MNKPGNRSTPKCLHFKTSDIHIGATTKRYEHTGKILGLNITSNNFFRKHIKMITGRAKDELKMLGRFRHLKKGLKLRLFKTLILPLLLYPIIPINACSKSQINKLQKIQDAAIRWIYNENPPTRCPIELRHRQLKLEYIADRIKRMAETIWTNIEQENGEFFQHTKQIVMAAPHNRFPSSYEATYA